MSADIPTNFDLLVQCMTCEARSAAGAREEIIREFLAIRDGREPPSDFARRDPPLPLNCCRRRPQEAAP
jgi:hypothetical protein